MGIKNKPIIRACPQCGADYEYRRASGRLFEVCEQCRQTDCVICGKKVPLERGKKNTCCIECEKLKIRSIQILHYAKSFAEDPDLNKRKHAARREARSLSAEAMEAHKQKERNRHYVRMANDEYVQKRKIYQAEYYAQRRDGIQKKRAEWWSGLSDEQKAERIEKNKESQRRSKQKYRFNLQQDPERWSAYQAYQRQKSKEHRRNKALADLQKQIKELTDVADTD